METIKTNLEEIYKNIEKAAYKSNRKKEDITLLAVTKTIDTDRIEKAVSLGLNQLGENRVQELMSKYDTFKDRVKWHLIGSLQTNKVKYIIDKVSLIHSVDSYKLLKEIDSRAGKNNIVMNVLAEVNIAGEESKHGISPGEVNDFTDVFSEFHNVRLKGLMSVAPYTINPEENRVYFKKMQKLYIDNGVKKVDNIDMEYLSMGMTNDYEIAIEEGANIVRIGTGIFGERKYI